MTVRFYSSVAQQVTLNSTINTSATSIVVSSTIGFPGSTPYTLAIDYNQANEELVEVTSQSGTTLTITRAVDGTSASTHSSGAFVRHVSSARDFADSRSHENATTNVHGLAVGSAVVGTTDTQSLSNKTLSGPILNSPTINGATLSGTLAGNTTFTGNNTFNGTSLFSGAVEFDGSAVALAPVGTTLVLGASETTDTNSRFAIRADGRIQFSDGSSLADLFLYRNSAGVLRTSGSLTVDGGITESTPTAWQSSGVTWTTSTGLHSPSLGNAVVAYQYKVISGTLYASLAITFGTTTDYGAGATTSDNWQFSLPTGLTASSAFRGTQLIVGSGRATMNASATSPFVVNLNSAGTSFILVTSGGQQDGNALANAGVIDALTPFTWTNGSVLAFSAVVPIT